MLAVGVHLESASAHDASAYGGMFRTHSMGASWINADAGLYISAALAVAVDPKDPRHLLMGTDSGLLSSVNAGRSWSPEAPELIIGAVFSIAFSPDGGIAVCSGPGGIFRWLDGSWQRSDAPMDAAPSRVIAFGAAPGQVYVIGRERLFVSGDRGADFRAVSDGNGQSEAFDALAVIKTPVETLFGLSQGRLMVSTSGGRQWLRRAPTGVTGLIETIATDPSAANRLWTAAADQLYVSDDQGQQWRAVGAKLPEPNTVVRGIAADAGARTLIVTSHRGTFRSTDAGTNWQLQEGNLPVHLEAGPLARDVTDPAVLYVVYSLVPYPEVWRNALEGGNLLARTDPISLIGGVAFLLLLLLSGGVLVAWLTRARRSVAGAAG